MDLSNALPGVNPWAIVQVLFWALSGLSWVVVVVIAWNVREQLARITKLEESKADKDALSELKQDMKDHRQETRDSFTRLFERVDTIVDRLPKS